MKWNEYKSAVKGSRDAIMIPWFVGAIKSVSLTDRIGLDIGCGDGDLTKTVSKMTDLKMLGVDINQEDIDKANIERSDTTHFLTGDITSNFISSVGIRFDFVMSNCCFSHLSDDDVFHCLSNVRSSISDGGTFLFLVTHHDWAKKMHDKVKVEVNGVSTVPRYGGRQRFRFPEWYVEVFRRCGFKVLSHDDVVIPIDGRLEERYSVNVGEPLFTGIVAVADDTALDSNKVTKAFDLAHDNRKFEIELFWKRSLFFGGFIAASMIAYGAMERSDNQYSIVFALFGLICSFIWSAGNRGSKYWQEYWEKKVTRLQHFVTDDIFVDHYPTKENGWSWLAPRRISVSKVAMALSDASIALWLLLIAADVVNEIESGEYLRASMTILGLGMALLFMSITLRKSKTED